MAQTKPKAGQFYGVSDNGTDGQFLKTDGTGGMSWDSPITNPTITSIDYPGTQTAADPAGGESVIINGTLFASGITCTVGGTSAVTAFNSATQITITTPAKAAGPYTVAVTNTNGGTASQANFIQYSGVPVWSTAAGTLGNVMEGATASFQVTATEGSDTIEYAVTTGTLPTGLSLATATGAITGTAGSVSADTTTTFSITATDDENQTSSSRSFSITVQNDNPSNYFTPVIYTGNDVSHAITGVGFKPDFVWIKRRSSSESHALYDSIRGINKQLSSNTTSAEATNTAPYEGFTSFDNDGFTVDNNGATNRAPNTYVAWCFKAGGLPTATNSGSAGGVPTSGSVIINGTASTAALAGTIAAKKISANTTLGFSVVEWTGTSNEHSIAHELGVKPSVVLIKQYDSSSNWSWYTDVIDGSLDYLYLNTTAAKADSGRTMFDSEKFYWALGGNYIAYCFASKPGFSKVGSYTATGSAGTPIVQTGFKPAFVMVKNVNKSQEWIIIDDKRNDGKNSLQPNSSAAENTAGDNAITLYANGFAIAVSGSGVNYQSGDTFIYLAIAADPSTTTPSLANSFATELYTGNASTNQISTVGFAPGFTWIKARNTTTSPEAHDVVRGEPSRLWVDNNYAASTVYNGFVKLTSNGFDLNNVGAGGNVNRAYNYVSWNWKAGGTPSINTDGTITSVVSVNQAAGFSVVKYTGNGSGAITVGHGLSSAPEMYIVKSLSTGNWWTYHSGLNGGVNPSHYFIRLDLSNAESFNASSGGSIFNSTEPTSTVFSGGTSINTSNGFIAYCFASISGYSKVGSYTGNGTLGHSIATGFTPGFVMIKRSSATGSWYLFDNKRTTGVYSDQLEANTANAEVTGTYVDLDSNGFSLNTTASNLNENGSTFIYLAIKEN